VMTDGGTTVVVGLAYCDARTEVRGCSGGHGESVGALNRHEVHCETGSPLKGVSTALWTQWRGSPKLKHSERENGSVVG
jgi:hypothetical protein